MPTFTAPDGDSLLEVNHCHGPGRGHPCAHVGDAFRSPLDPQKALNAKITKGLVKVVSDVDQSVWWTTPEVAARGTYKHSTGHTGAPGTRRVRPFPKDAYGRWSASINPFAKEKGRLIPKKRKR